MSRHPLLSLFLCPVVGFLVFSSPRTAFGSGPAQDGPTLTGYVTRASSASDFDVNGLHVALSPGTTFWSTKKSTPEVRTSAKSLPRPYMGEYVAIRGQANWKTSTIMAQQVGFYLPEPVTVSGSAIIDRVLPAEGGSRVFQADGRRLRVSTALLSSAAAHPSTSSTAATPADIRTNIWVDYKGVLREDGVVEIASASFADNAVGHSEDKLRTRQEYDPAAVPEDSKQSGASKFFRGFDPKQLAPYKDDAMQARVTRIGESLIPAYQKALPVDEETRIQFRFQLVDGAKWHDAITLPNGIILVPHQVIERLKNDSQVAAVLADNIATALEKRAFRQQGKVHALQATDIAGTVGGLVVPGLGIATGVATWKSGKAMLAHAELQSGRVALTLMHDAGYDVTQAPEAWWILETKEAKDGTEARRGAPPPRAVNQLEELGTTWRPALAGTGKPGVEASASLGAGSQQ